MTVSIPNEKVSITKENIRGAAKAGGPCVSLFLGPYAPGAGKGSEQVWLKNALADIRLELERHHIPPEELEPVMEPLEALSAEQGHTQGRCWLAWPGGVVAFDTDNAAGRGWAVAQQPFLLPLLDALAVPPEFYVLGLSKQNVSLFHCTASECTPVPLPDTVPSNLDRTMAFDPPDHDRDNRAPSGGMAGQKRGIRFGTGDESETAGQYLHLFFKKLDRALPSVLNNKAVPVVVAGVRYEAAEFQRASEVVNTVKEGFIEGPVRDMTPAEIHANAMDVLRKRHADAMAELTARLRESERKVENSTEALKAALDGQVWKLFVTQEKPAAWLASWRHYLELNRVLVEALRHGADVYTVPAEQMPEGTPVAAQLRY